MRSVLTVALVAVSWLPLGVAAQDALLGDDYPVPNLGLSGLAARPSTAPECAAARQALSRAAALFARTRRANLPPLTATPTQAELERWAEQQLVHAIRVRTADLRAVDRVTSAVIDSGCTAESIEVLARRGRANELLASQLQAIPPPSDMPPELWGIYQSHVEMPAVFRHEARRSYRVGLQLARRHRAFGRWSQACVAGLIRLGEVAADAELHGRELREGPRVTRLRGEWRDLPFTSETGD